MSKHKERTTQKVEIVAAAPGSIGEDGEVQVKYVMSVCSMWHGCGRGGGGGGGDAGAGAPPLSGRIYLADFFSTMDGHGFWLGAGNRARVLT